MDKFRHEIIEVLKKATGLSEISLEVPPNPEMGDFAFPCFTLSKELKKNPNEIAQDLCKKISLSDIILKTEVKGPFLNFFVNKNLLMKDTLISVVKLKAKFGSSLIGKGKKALIEHTSINPNASPHVGRARNAIIGDSLTRLLKFQGYKTEAHYLVNDIGKQIAMLVVACKGKKISFDKLLELYIDFNKQLEAKPELEQEVFAVLNKLESGDKKTAKQFRGIVDVCIKGQSAIFSELGINYDYFDYESDYLFNKETERILALLKETKKLFTDEEGRLVLDLQGFDLAMKSAVFVLTRKDGTSLYGLRDIAYNIYKIKRGKDLNIIVLGEDQKLYFQQIKAALSFLGEKAPVVVHYSFVLLAEGKMSTRKGNLVLLEDFMSEIKEKAKQEIIKRSKTKGIEKLSEIIGYGALKYSILKVSPEKNVVFDWSAALSFEGESAPYIQYAYARICSILEKYGKNVASKVDYALLDKKEEHELIKSIAEFKQVVDTATAELRPHLVAVYLQKLAKQFNEYYHLHKILGENDDVMKARLLLISCVKQVLATGLSLLGIDAPENM